MNFFELRELFLFFFILSNVTIKEEQGYTVRLLKNRTVKKEEKRESKSIDYKIEGGKRKKKTKKDVRRSLKGEGKGKEKKENYKRFQVNTEERPVLPTIFYIIIIYLSLLYIEFTSARFDYFSINFYSKIYIRHIYFFSLFLPLKRGPSRNWNYILPFQSFKKTSVKCFN